MRRPFASALALSLVALATPATPATAGVWFDIGGGMPTTVYADNSVTTCENYQPFPFGRFPAGSLVYEQINVVPCESLGESGQLCGETLFIRGFHCEFYGVNCGCMGALVIPTQLQLSYDPLVVLSTGAQEANLKLLYRDEDFRNWSLLPGATLDTEKHMFTVPWKDNVLGMREFAILTQDVTPVASDTWGRVKVLYRR